MARPLLLAALAAVLLCLLPATADARSVTLTVWVKTTEYEDGKPKPAPAGTKVEVTDMQLNKLGSGTTDADGRATITFDLSDDKYAVLVDADVKGADGRGTFETTIIRSGNPTAGVSHLDVGKGNLSEPNLVELVNAAVAKCDKAAYDRWVAELDRRVAYLEKLADPDAHARANNLRVMDLKGAQKDLKRAEEAQAKLDPALRNTDALWALQLYVYILENQESFRGSLGVARKARASVPPFPVDCKKDKVGLLPGQKACPDGSGGLLASALNDLFDSDFDPACDDRSRRRDTDRAKKDRREREERRRD